MKAPSFADRFELADATRRIRSIILASGDVGAGKTRFSLTGPMPTLVQSLDRGLEGVVEEFLEQGKEIRTVDYRWTPGAEDFSQAFAKEVREQFVADYTDALDAGARTIVWDKETDVWEMFRYAEFGKPNDAPKDYAKLNQRYIALVNRVKDYDASLVCIQSMKEDWGQVGPVSPTSGKRGLAKTGTKSRRGFDRLDEIVFAELHFRREPSSDPEVSGPEYFIDVGKCRQNSALQNQTLPGMTMAEFGTYLLPGTTLDESS